VLEQHLQLEEELDALGHRHPPPGGEGARCRGCRLVECRGCRERRAIEFLAGCRIDHGQHFCSGGVPPLSFDVVVHGALADELAAGELALKREWLHRSANSAARVLSFSGCDRGYLSTGTKENCDSSCRSLPSRPKTASAPSGAATFMAPNTRLAAGSPRLIQIAGSSGSCGKASVALTGVMVAAARRDSGGVNPEQADTVTTTSSA